MTLFSGKNREKPRFAAFARAVLRQAEDLIALIPQMESGFSVESAEGIRLDAIGDSFGIPRPEGLGDGDYRALLRAKLALFRWNGSNDTIFRMLTEYLPGAVFTDNQDTTVTIRAPGTLPLPAREYFPVPAGMKPAEE